MLQTASRQIFYIKFTSEGQNGVLWETGPAGHLSPPCWLGEVSALKKLVLVLVLVTTAFSALEFPWSPESMSMLQRLRNHFR